MGKKSSSNQYYEWWSLKICVVGFREAGHGTKCMLKLQGLLMPLSTDAPQEPGLGQW